MKPDRARSSTSRLSSNGLMEINRQRVGQQLTLRTHIVCETCRGTGWLPGPDVTALGLLRRIEAKAAEVNLARARVHLHPEVAQMLQNSRRAQIAALEHAYKFTIEVLASPTLKPGEERLEWRVRTGLAPEDPRETPAHLAAPVTQANTVAAPEGEGTELTQVEDSSKSREGASRPRGRRRRGENPRAASRGRKQSAGRNKKTGGADEPGESGEAKTATEGKDESREPSQSSSSRRRRRRRRNKKPAAAEDGASSAQQAAPEKQGDQSGEPAKSSSSRRRSRRRRRKPASSANAPATDGD